MNDLPFLKWAGGKRWLAPRLGAILDTHLHLRLVEPFLGSGAVFFQLKPSKALLADCNTELIAAFRAVKDTPDTVIRLLRKLEINREVFEQLRSARPRTDSNKAARLIYLNRTAFNGLYRVNQLGRFNVPFGCKPGTQLCSESLLLGASRSLKNAAIKCQDFRVTLKRADAKRDILYIDPPYTVKHDNNGFRRYNDNIFSWKDQEDLAKILNQLASDGAPVIVSNAHHEEVTNLYSSEHFHVLPIERSTCMAASAVRRGSCTESLIVSKAIEKSSRILRAKLGI